MNIFEQILDMVSRVPRWTADSYRNVIPGNTLLDEGARESYARFHADPKNDYYTEVPVSSFSSPNGPIRIEIFRGITVTGRHYVRSQMSNIRDSRTGVALPGFVEALYPLSSANPTEYELFTVARHLYLKAYMHEAEENFKWNGEHVLDPHTPFEKLEEKIP